MTQRSIRFILAGMLLVAVGAAPFLAQGDQQTRQIMAQNAAVISRMSLSQRERLNQNFRDYLNLSDAERERLRQFHQQLEQDKAQNHGELANVLKIYDSWLKSLNPHQRDQLGKTTQGAERLALINDLLNRQREETGRRLVPTPMMPRNRVDRPFEVPPTLNDATRLAIFAEIEKQLEPRLDETQKQELSSLQGIRREIKTLQFLREAGAGGMPQPLLERLPAELITVANSLSQLTSDQRLLEFVANGPLLETSEERRNEAPEARRLAALLMQSMTVELVRLHQAKESSIDEKKLREFLDSLPEEDQRELLSLDTLDFQTDLKKQYLDLPQAREALDLPRFREVSELFVDRGSFRRPFGGDRSPGGGRSPRRFEGRDPMSEGIGPGRFPPGPPPPLQERGPRPDGPPRIPD